MSLCSHQMINPIRTPSLLRSLCRGSGIGIQRISTVKEQIIGRDWDTLSTHKT